MAGVVRRDTACDEASEVRQNVFVEGMALFKEDKLVGFFDCDETKDYNLIVGNIESGVFIEEVDFDKELATVEVLDVNSNFNRCFFNFSFMPTAGISPANQDAWLAEILSGLLIFISVTPLMIMASHFRDKTYEEYLEIILGKVLGKVFGLIYAIYLTIVIMLTIVFLSDFLVSAVLPETPLYVILLFMIIPCTYHLKG